VCILLLLGVVALVSVSGKQTKAKKKNRPVEEMKNKLPNGYGTKKLVENLHNAGVPKDQIADKLRHVSKNKATRSMLTDSIINDIPQKRKKGKKGKNVPQERKRSETSKASQRKAARQQSSRRR
jgi:hypothetical protein